MSDDFNMNFAAAFGEIGDCVGDVAAEGLKGIAFRVQALDSRSVPRSPGPSSA